ncbi:dihydrolipoyl dehydrogenase [Methylophaga sp. OBS4]|uniref:dihydrolipoyl dehydrogenase n=1 Tax=Methylophaga sp. OBS4 TaxID=2991935 RepID=UPI0022553EFA|nr:dihydrolipoyl dehydrogenase [Methylophaga sp. OBS4]MCX4187892.1 dihydrolipoyl dehydrogenase [Methylophaga sp. OBS4]
MSIQTEADVVVIGAGTAGLAAIKEVKKVTDRYLLINDGPYGTTCARVGCMPSKLLIEAANAFHRRYSFEAFGIRHAEALQIDIPAVMQRVRDLRDYYVASTLKAVHELGDKNISGRARLLSANLVEVNDQQIAGRKIIIATGSRPIVPSAWLSLGDKLLTTDTLFEQHDFKQRVAVIGLGAIGVEIAQALARLGITVTGFGAGNELAGLTDPAVNQALHDSLQKEFAIHLGDNAELTTTDTGIQVTAGAYSVEVDQVIAAVGRQPNIDNIGFDNLGVALDDNGMPDINPQTMQVADLPVFLAGDASADTMLLHEVADEGHIAGHNAVAEKVEAFCRRTPLSIVFSAPETAMVGRSYAECESHPLVVGQASYTDQGRARAALQNVGLMRIYADKTNGRLLGAEMSAPDAGHMAHILALAIQQQLSVEALLAMPIYHPVLEEGMRSALRDVLSQRLETTQPFDLARCDSFQSEALD